MPCVQCGTATKKYDQVKNTEEKMPHEIWVHKRTLDWRFRRKAYNLLFQQYLRHWSFIEWQKHNDQSTAHSHFHGAIFSFMLFSLESFPGYGDTVNT